MEATMRVLEDAELDTVAGGDWQIDMLCDLLSSTTISIDNETINNATSSNRGIVQMSAGGEPNINTGAVFGTGAILT